MDAPTVTLPRPRAGRLSSAYLDWIQMLTGAGLIIFMWTHLVLVSSVLVSPRAMNAIAAFFEDTGLIYLAVVGVFAIFFTHFILAARKLPWRTAEQARIWAHANRMHHHDTWTWMIQAGSAMIILVMASIHIAVVVSSLPITAAHSAARVQSGWIYFYLVLLPLVELHVGIGFYRIGVKWGFIGRSGRWAFRRKENVLTAMLIVIGVATLLRFLLLAPQ